MLTGGSVYSLLLHAKTAWLSIVNVHSCVRSNISVTRLNIRLQWLVLPLLCYPCSLLFVTLRNSYISYRCTPCGLGGRCRKSPPRFLAECCKRQLNQGSFVLLYFEFYRLFTFSDLYWVCLSVFSCTVLFVSISQVIGCENHLQNDLYCVEWGVKLYSNQPNLVLAHMGRPGKRAVKRVCVCYKVKYLLVWVRFIRVGPAGSKIARSNKTE